FIRPKSLRALAELADQRRREQVWQDQISQVVELPLALLAQHDSSPDSPATQPVGFDFRPGANGGTYPDTRHCQASIFLPSSKRVRLQVITAPVDVSHDSRSRTLTSGIFTSLA